MTITDSSAPGPQHLLDRRASGRAVGVVAVGVVLAFLVVVIGRHLTIDNSTTGGSRPNVPVSSSASTASPSPKRSEAASPSRAATRRPSPSTGTATGPTSTVPATPPVTAPSSRSQIETKKPVPIKDEAPFGDGVSARIASVVPIQSKAQGVGEISGPAIKVTVKLENSTKEALALDQATVNVAFGKRHVPAIGIAGDPSSQPFAGTVASGSSAIGVYIFNVPLSERDEVSVSLSYAALSPIVVFSGAVR